MSRPTLSMSPKSQLPVSLPLFPVPLTIGTQSPHNARRPSWTEAGLALIVRAQDAHRHTPGWDSAVCKEAWEPHPRTLPHGVLHSLPLAPPSRAFLTQAPGENKSHSLAFPGMRCQMLQLLFSLMLVSLGSVGRSGAGEWGVCAGAPLEGSQLGFAGCRM